LRKFRRKFRKHLCHASTGQKLQQTSQGRTLGDVEEHYTVSEAAKLLGISGSRVRQLLTSGELEGEQDPPSDRWRVSRASVHARREERGTHARRPSSAPPADPTPWVERIAELERALGRAEARGELTEQAHSSTLEALERERERADRLEERAEKLRDELEAERSKGFWARLFGG
jgi:excisionase family DNA binding protein